MIYFHNNIITIETHSCTSFAITLYTFVFAKLVDYTYRSNKYWQDHYHQANQVVNTSEQLDATPFMTTKALK